LAAARALGVAPDSLVPTGGRSGDTWGAGSFVLRVRPTTRLDAELAAATAAAHAVPVPGVADRADMDGVSAVLLRRLAGTPAGDVARLTVAQARARGQACGRLHIALAAVTAPAGCALVSGWTAPSAADRLLHLDLHPHNVLVDGATVTGVIDWANARSGPAVLDRARTLSILTVDPGTGPWRQDPRGAALIDGWLEAGGLESLDGRPRAWAYRFMLDDLADRYQAAELAGVRSALEAADAAPG
jgi:Ser/Thr protein kinase RdoA (MazF antagonist)